MELREPNIEEYEKLDIFKGDLLSRQEVEDAAQLMGIEIWEDHKDEEPLCIYVANGGEYIATEIQKTFSKLNFNPEFTSISVERTTQESGFRQPLITKDIPEHIDLTGRTVIIFEDIIDEGETIEMLRQELLKRGAARVEVAVLLERQSQKPEGYVPPKYRGFRLAGDAFVFGSGLDDGRLPDADGGRYVSGVLMNYPFGKVPGVDFNHRPDSGVQ